MEFALFYGLSVLWRVVGVATVIALVGAIGVLILLVIHVMAYLEGDNETKDSTGRLLCKMKWPAIVVVAVIALTPSKDDLYFIAGGGLTLMAAQNEEVQKLPENAVKAVNSFLERVSAEQPEQ